MVFFFATFASLREGKRFHAENAKDAKKTLQARKRRQRGSLETHRQALAIGCSADISRHALNPLFEGGPQLCPIRRRFQTFQAVHLKPQII
jgi:hypothetical protein